MSCCTPYAKFLPGRDCVITADPDIAGIGIIISFIAITGISISLALVIQLLKITKSKHPLLAQFLTRNLLGFSDQQLITGIGLQITGLIRLNSTSLYHANIIASLVELSTSTHVLTLFFLRDYFLELQHQLARNVRLCLMIVNITMLLAYLLQALSFDTEKRPCYGIINDNARVTRIGTFVLYGLNFSGTAFAMWILFSQSSVKSFSLTSGIANRIANGILRFLTLRTDTLLRKSTTTFLSVYVGGFLPAIAAISLWVFSHNVQYTEAMYKGPPPEVEVVRFEGKGTEKEWTYGQIFPLILLLLPLLNACANYSEMKSEERSNTATTNDSIIPATEPVATNETSTSIRSTTEAREFDRSAAQGIRRQDTEALLEGRTSHSRPSDSEVLMSGGRSVHSQDDTEPLVPAGRNSTFELDFVLADGTVVRRGGSQE